jgi:hypothetical protein
MESFAVDSTPKVRLRFASRPMRPSYHVSLARVIFCGVPHRPLARA